ncbi:MAG TPA: alpha-1,4-glucan--maltose-1-phosphate maltosyltransferase [Xanthobacteraceae bacterium]|nr:alpha-1,4-glucan--maltose-1-phosphate maltosyltransferase [Xanthobacteraceae bacterium]
MTQAQRVTPSIASAFSASESATKRIFFEDVFPSVDEGRYPVKRIAGEHVEVWADIFRDGHEVIAGSLCWRRQNDRKWLSTPLQFHQNDRWHASFRPETPGRYVFALVAWTDAFATWRRDYLLKRGAGADLTVEKMVARKLLQQFKAPAEAAAIIRHALEEFDATGSDEPLLRDDLANAARDLDPRPDLTWSTVYPLTIDRPRARAGAWYELFPRSQTSSSDRHGTFDDCIARVPQIAALGYDVLYFPPIHPIGRANRKGRNNSLTAGPDDPGSPYAIGSAEGGHDAIHPQLGTLADFRRLVETCHAHGMEIALDFALQCSPDHPWLKQHPEWFKWQPDGSLKYAENPPKKYEDIVNPDLLCADRAALWSALRDVILFWHRQGVKIFRVDNPHTKPLPFWEWLINEVQSVDPEVIFLSEAFTRPKIMKALAKLGFTQSYTYFTWRTTKSELTAYLQELTAYPEREYYRPNFFVNTPDINPYHLQSGERWMFQSRVALAATLSSNYGVYSGFELMEHVPIAGKEEYLDSEKYEIKPRDWNQPGNINDYIGTLNRIRRENPALLQTQDLRFLAVDNDDIIGFVKESVGHDNAVAAAIALQRGRREFWLHFGDLRIGPPDRRSTVKWVENLVTGERRHLEWGGLRLTIDTEHDPALLFRCFS